MVADTPKLVEAFAREFLSVGERLRDLRVDPFACAFQLKNDGRKVLADLIVQFLSDAAPLRLLGTHDPARA